VQAAARGVEVCGLPQDAHFKFDRNQANAVMKAKMAMKTATPPPYILSNRFLMLTAVLSGTGTA
jgi:hypothetical protein